MFKTWSTDNKPAFLQSGVQVPPGKFQDHPGLRRLTPAYKRKKKLVRKIWLVSLLIMIPFSLGAKLALALATSFLGLVILDETQ